VRLYQLTLTKCGPLNQICFADRALKSAIACSRLAVAINFAAYSPAKAIGYGILI
jgi:hypothetical protein